MCGDELVNILILGREDDDEYTGVQGARYAWFHGSESFHLFKVSLWGSQSDLRTCLFADICRSANLDEPIRNREGAK